MTASQENLGIAGGYLGLNINLSKLDGHHPAAWAAPESSVADFDRFGTYLDLVQSAERVGIDAVFAADVLAYDRERSVVPQVFEPISFLSALAAVTSHIGLVATISTTFSDPFTVARQIASLDTVSNGRSALNLVTSAIDAAARNHGLPALPAHELRYQRATEYAEVVKGLLRNWPRSALRYDAATGTAVDPAQIPALAHAGAHFSVAGPFTTYSPPQGLPVFFQAGTSQAGRNFAVAHADVIYSGSRTLDEAIETRHDLSTRARAAGRAQAPKIFRSFVLVIEEDARDAQERFRRLQQDRDGVVRLHRTLQQYLPDFDPASPDSTALPSLPALDSVAGNRSGLIALHNLVAQHSPRTLGELRDLHRRSPGDHQFSVGGAASIADEIERWFRSGAIDGVTLLPAVTQRDLAQSYRLLLPELIDRGLRPESWGEAETLRARYGLATIN